jgi:GntR family transcriptional regulator
VSKIAAPDPPPRSNRYEQIADEIEADILAEDLEPGTRLRSERELAVAYGCAYVTLRKAIAVLRERGIVETRHGQGTYVIRKPDPK